MILIGKKKLLYLFFLTLFFLGVRTIGKTYSSDMIDFSAYYNSAKQYTNNQNPYISNYLPLLYPPASIIIFLPLTLFNYQVAKSIWGTIIIFSIFLGLHLTFQDLKKMILITNPLFAEALFILLCLQLFPVKFSLAQGQINSLVFLLIVLIPKLIKKHSLLLGLTLATIINLKLIPFVLMLYPLLKRKLAFLGSLTFFLVTPNLIVSHYSRQRLLSTFFEKSLLKVDQVPQYYYNQSLQALLYRLHLSPELIILTIIIFSLATIIFLIQKNEVKSVYPILLSFMTLISPITWQHHLIWTIPCFVHLANNRMQSIRVLGLVSFILINSNIKFPDQFFRNQLIYSHATFGLIILFITLVISSTPSVYRIPHVTDQQFSSLIV